MLDSLVRVSRRVAYNHYASILAEARSSVPAGRIAPRAIRLPRKEATFPRPLSDRRNRCWPDRRASAPLRTAADRLRAGLVASASLSTISRTVSLSFQSAFHLSITLLVRYRSPASI